MRKKKQKSNEITKEKQKINEKQNENVDALFFSGRTYRKQHLRVHTSAGSRRDDGSFEPNDASARYVDASGLRERASLFSTYEMRTRQTKRRTHERRLQGTKILLFFFKKKSKNKIK